MYTAHTHILCTHVAHKCLHGGKSTDIYKQVYIPCTNMTQRTRRHTEFTHNGHAGHTRAHCWVSCTTDTHAQTQHTRYLCTQARQPHSCRSAHSSVFPFPLAHALSLSLFLWQVLTLWPFWAFSPQLPIWNIRSRWNLLTVFCASSLPFFCFWGWRS